MCDNGSLRCGIGSSSFARFGHLEQMGDVAFVEDNWTGSVQNGLEYVNNSRLIIIQIGEQLVL